jgi:hypothetical protein
MVTTQARRPSTGSRRAGYAASIVVNVVMLWLVNGWPGWDVLPFLTADFQDVLWLVNASMVVAIALNLAYLVRDPRWLTSAGAVVTTAVGLAAVVAMLRVFPFDFGDSDVWPVVFRILLWVALAGSVVGIVVNLVALVRALGARSPVVDAGSGSGAR